ncbi:MFS transporter [Amycolatopsis samaneae]|uniref:MFS transporter n=1 Tax=Amycolatopsis samaneae TaxID=664691 RepID=A0ABW5GKE9_9PSEU
MSASLPVRRRRLVLGTCCLSLFIASLDNTVLQIALPSLRRELAAPLSGLQWTIDAYTLVLASSFMAAGALADRFGRRRVFMIGLGVFTAGSLLCSLAPTLTTLIVFRMVQAIGGAMLTPVAMSIVTDTFRDPAERARAIGVWAAVVGLAMATGPLLGGLLVDAAGWRSIFWINLPIGLLALTLTWRFVPESRAGTPRRADPAGQLLVFALLAVLTYTIIQAPDRGLWSARTLWLADLAIALLITLIWHERRRDQPLIELRLFRSPPFTGAVVIVLAGFGTLTGFLFLNTLYLQDVRHLDALHAGLWLMPMAVMTFLAGPLSGHLLARHGPRVPLLVAGTGITTSGILFAFDGQAHALSLMLGCAVYGLGFGCVNAPTIHTAVSGMPTSRAAVASSLVSTFRQTGGALGVAVVGSVLATRLTNTGDVHADTYLDAARPTWWIITGSGIAILTIAQLTTRRPHPPTTTAPPATGRSATNQRPLPHNEPTQR